MTLVKKGDKRFKVSNTDANLAWKTFTMIQVQGVTYSCKTFGQLTNLELYKILQMRELVFALEQQVFYKDLDDKDLYCYHLTGYKHDELVSYCRIIHSKNSNDYEGNAEFVTIGRVLTPPAKRKQGFGVQLINQAIIVCKTLSDAKITIQAQAYLERFYSSFGFKTLGDQYLYEGIMHINMELDTLDVNIVNQNQSKIYKNLLV